MTSISYILKLQATYADCVTQLLVCKKQQRKMFSCLKFPNYRTFIEQQRRLLMYTFRHFTTGKNNQQKGTLSKVVARVALHGIYATVTYGTHSSTIFETIKLKQDYKDLIYLPFYYYNELNLTPKNLSFSYYISRMVIHRFQSQFGNKKVGPDLCAFSHSLDGKATFLHLNVFLGYIIFFIDVGCWVLRIWNVIENGKFELYIFPEFA